MTKMFAGFNQNDYAYDNYSDSEFVDVSEKFFSFLGSQASKIDATFSIMTIGMKRSGKTLTSMAITEKLMKTDKSRIIVLYKCPESLFIELKKTFPGRIKFAKTLLDCDVKNAIVYVDEGLVGLNAKQALTLELREFGQALAFTSHKRIILLINAQDDGVIRDLRNKCEIVIYKRLSRFFINSCNDKFITEHAELFRKLKREKHIITGNSFDFTETGYLTIKMSDCSFWSDNLSHNMENVSLSVEHQKRMDNKVLITKCADEILAKLKKRALKVRLIPFITYFYKNKDLELFSNIKSIIPDIAIEIYGKAVLTKFKKDDEDDQDVDPIINKNDVEKEDNFPVYALNHFPKTEKLNQIYYLLLSGSTQRTICDSLGVSLTKVNQAIQIMSENEIGYQFEDFFAASHNGDKRGFTAHHKSIPDFIDQEGNVYSLKYRYKVDKTITFYQSADFSPEFKYCKKAKIPQYTAVLYNPRWIERTYSLQIRLNDIDKVVFRR